MRSKDLDRRGRIGDRVAEGRCRARRSAQGTASSPPGFGDTAPKAAPQASTAGPIGKGTMAETVAHVVGARPNFMKAAPVIRALTARSVPQVIVHTGQHYDDRMSEVFFRELDLPRPDLNLGVGSGSHASQTARIMVALEGAFADLDPALIVVYGDVNSTARGGGRRGQARAADRPRRGGSAQLRPDDAGGDQPGRHRRPVGPPVHHEPGGRDEPRPRGDRPRAGPLRRQPDDRHAARQPRPVRRGSGSRPARARRTVWGGDAPPAGQCRRSGDRRPDRGRHPRCRGARPPGHPAPSARPGRRSRRPAWPTIPG